LGIKPQARKACGTFTLRAGTLPDWTETGIMGRCKRR
jgi:hypothetical protein